MLDHSQQRRKFLRLALLGAGGAPLIAGGIQRADDSNEQTHIPSLTRHAGQARITEVHAFAVRRATYVKVVADDGTSGWGEAGHSGGVLVAQLVNRELNPLLTGKDVFDGDPHWSRMYFQMDELGPSGLAAQAIAGVDCALWDLRGKLLGLPVWKLLGGTYRNQIPLYGSFSRAKNDSEYLTPTECARQAATLVQEGFGAIKVRLGIREENVDPVPDPAVPVVREIRSAIGHAIELYVDVNNGYTASRAITIGRILAEEHGVALLEEPVAAYQYAGLASVAGSLDIPVSAGEHEYTKWQFRDLILQGHIDVLNPDCSKLAGLTEAMKVSALAEVFDLPISVHNARPTLLTAAHLHYLAASRMASRTQEHPGAKRLVELWQFFENTIEISKGMATVPNTPGLGLIPIEAAIRKAELS